MKLRLLRWPYPYRWAFGITDDTDGATVDTVREVYEFCLSLGIRPTKSVWTHPATEPCGYVRRMPPDPGVTLEDAEYRAYCQGLAARGVEISLHGASAGNNTREQVIAGFARVREVFGAVPPVYTCHSLNAEHPHWGESHFGSPITRRAARALLRRRERFFGEVEGDPHYWLDHCWESVRYVRLFRTLDLNVLRRNPSMPYHQHDKPGVRFWFSATAQDHEACRKVSRRAMDRLAREDGAFLLYAHMHHFVSAGASTESGLRGDVEGALRLIGEREDCWKAGASEILDRCLASKNLIVTVRRRGTVVTNPTAVPLPDFQFASRARTLYLRGGVELRPDRDGCYRLDLLAAHGAVVLYPTLRDAVLEDPCGIPDRERYGMVAEEAKHVVWQHFGAFNGVKERWARLTRREPT